MAGLSAGIFHAHHVFNQPYKFIFDYEREKKTDENNIAFRKPGEKIIIIL